MNKYKITIELKTSNMDWFFNLMHNTTMELDSDEALEWAFTKMEEEE